MEKIAKEMIDYYMINRYLAKDPEEQRYWLRQAAYMVELKEAANETK